MAAGKTKSIYEIEDMVEMRELMAALDISSKGLKTLDDMKSRVRDELGQSENTPMWTAGQAFSILSEATDDDSRKKKVLLNLYNETEKLLAETNPNLLPLLQQNVGNFKEKMKHHKVQLERRECFLLVAGETGSGKSSLVNLILGEELLPYSALSKSSTICELKFGKERKIVAHFFPPMPVAYETIHLKQCQTDSAEQGYLQQISRYVQEKGQGSFFMKIELFWPHSLLERGVVIIDSPGIGESDFMDQVVAQYLPQAFAFIYVIDSGNAGGVQKDRLQKLLEEVRKISLEGQRGFLPMCALFVCNKWDRVPEKETEKVKHHVIRKLQSCWPGLDPQTQIIYMSTMKAGKAQNHGFITDDFSTLMNGLRCMVLKSVGATLQFHWKWLDSLLSLMIYQAKAFVGNASRDRDKGVQEKIFQRMLEIDKENTEVIVHFHRYLRSRVDDAFQKLSEYLSSEDAKARFTSWALHEVPKADDSWEVTRNEITKALANRLRDFLEQWEEENKVFANARESLLQHFQSRYNCIEGQLRNLQSAIADDIPDVPESQPPERHWLRTVNDLVFEGVADILLLPFVPLLVGIPLVMAFYRRRCNENEKQKYKYDKCAFMTEISTKYFEAAKEESVLHAFVGGQIEEVANCLKQIKDRLPEMIQADKRLCKLLRHDTRSQKYVQQLYEPIMDEGSRLRGHLALFGITEVRATDISSEDLDWKESTSSRLGSGAFGVVYEGAMKRKGFVHPVALKVFNEVLDVRNSSIIMAEVKRLRKLDHTHIIKFYGTSLIWERNTVRMILVMEKCKGNLKSHIFVQPESAPGKSRNPVVVRNVCQWVKQITAALTYIHEQGIVHRDLKLENILISDDNLVKVTKVGVSKPAIDITGTLAGAPVYIAHEMFHSKMYDFKADIYSLGIMLWEMWYGEQAFSMVPVKPLRAFFDFVDGGQRPEHVKGCKQPPLRWKELMNECWERNPEKRPTAERCYEEMTSLIAELATDTGQQQATPKNQWQMEELLDETETMRVCEVHDATEKGIEEEEQRWTIDQQKHERKSKRTGEEAELHQPRESLTNYDFIECPKVSRRAFQELEVDDIDDMGVAIIGPDGPGKTCHIGARMFSNEMDEQEQKGVKEEQTSQKELTEMQQQELERARLHKLLSEKTMSMTRIKKIRLRGKDKQQQNLQRQLREMEQQLTNCHGQLRQKDELLREKDEQLREKYEQLRENDERLKEKDKQLTEKDEQLRENEDERIEIYEQLREKDEQLRDKYVELTEKDQQVNEKDAQLREKDEEQENLQEQLEEMEQQLREKEQQDENLQRQLREMGRQLTNFEEQLREKEEEISNVQQQNFTLESQLRGKEGEINELEMSLLTTQQAISEQRHQGSCDWVIARDEIQISEKCLGRGGWGSVYEGMYCGCTVAVKQIHELILSPHNTRLFEREMDIASRCRHPCLLQFIGATNDEGSPLFVTELMEASLRELLQQQKLSETEVAVISLDVAKAINYLHEKKPAPIIHRDVSSANVLLWRHGDQWRGKVSDYGTANFMQHTMTVAPGAMIYSAPEALTSSQTVKIDVYSYGVLLCEMNIRELPDPIRRNEQVARVTNRALRGLVRRCLQTEPEMRPSMLEIIESLRQLNVKG